MCSVLKAHWKKALLPFFHMKLGLPEQDSRAPGGWGAELLSVRQAGAREDNTASFSVMK